MDVFHSVAGFILFIGLVGLGINVLRHETQANALLSAGASDYVGIMHAAEGRQ